MSVYGERVRRSVRKGAVLAVVAGGVVAGAVAVAGPAVAAPDGCTSEVTSVPDGSTKRFTFTVRCTGGDGAYRPQMTCYRYRTDIPWPGTVPQYVLGAWTVPGPGSSASVTCRGETRTTSVQYR
ncbi:hypothetical protein [Actinomadura flavalba]|uniref:hypothetical protein n=1 Tax=Actinomadura flavalba TaxID=1120938 RepID=UPI00037C958D|nr:hypothetical protein [Actinomadura flavalba]